MVSTLAANIRGWALPYVGGALSIGAIVLIVLAVRAIRNTTPTPRTRWGNAVGYLGLSVCCLSLGVAMLLGIGFMGVPMIAFAAGFVATAIGGSFAGWTGGPPNVG